MKMISGDTVRVQFCGGTRDFTAETARARLENVVGHREMFLSLDAQDRAIIEAESIIEFLEQNASELDAMAEIGHPSTPTAT